MSERDDRLPMHQMLEHAREAIEVLRGKTRADLRADRTLQLALVALVGIVGEAARRVSVAGQASHPQIPWRQVIATRNRLLHGYDTIDYDVLWETIEVDFPPLVAALERALAERPD